MTCRISHVDSHRSVSRLLFAFTTLLLSHSHGFPSDGSATDLHSTHRFKREFMYASGQNETDPTCFQVCCVFLLLRVPMVYQEVQRLCFADVQRRMEAFHGKGNAHQLYRLLRLSLSPEDFGLRQVRKVLRTGGSANTMLHRTMRGPGKYKHPICFLVTACPSLPTASFRHPTFCATSNGLSS